MNDQAAVVATGALGAAIASSLPGIDPEAVIGAFFGAMTFVTLATEYPVSSRLLLLLPSWFLGYESAGLINIGSTGLSAGIGATLYVACASAALNAAKSGKLMPWSRK